MTFVQARLRPEILADENPDARGSKGKGAQVLETKMEKFFFGTGSEALGRFRPADVRTAVLR